MRKLEGRKIVVATHNEGKIREIDDLLGPFGLERAIGARTAACRSRKRPARPSRKTPRSRRSAAATATGPAGACRTIPACASMRSTARRASTPPTGRRARTAGAISPWPWRRSRRRWRPRARSRPPSARAASSPCSALPGPTGMRNISAARSRARSSGRRAARSGFGYDPVFLPDGFTQTFGEMEAGAEAWLGSRARRPRRCRTARGLSQSSPRNAWERRCERLEHCPAKASASTSTGRSARPSAPIATSTAMSATSRSTRRRFVAALCARSRTWPALAPGRDRDQHLLRRRHALADGAGDGRARSSTRIASHWNVARRREITLEANPSSVEAERFRGYRAAGVNRVSLGVQSLDDAQLRFLGRLHNVDGGDAAPSGSRARSSRASPST